MDQNDQRLGLDVITKQGSLVFTSSRQGLTLRVYTNDDMILPVHTMHIDNSQVARLFAYLSKVIGVNK